MVNRYSRTRDVFLDSEALAICQSAFNAILTRLDISREHENAEDIAAFVSKLYQQGIHDEKKLFELSIATTVHFRD
ncbi:hypothetical protein [Rhizobium tropici]|uniref:Uncharacterized protein n=1 Tax=Rhizobium tropici TaxID=398 RepID=A0A329YAS1_RHITR|nr:hypothetical protein [Rhizobium tropici]RAX41249.1 hypothetical protein DQ393_11815 [Rhizobium tropici]